TRPGDGRYSSRANHGFLRRFDTVDDRFANRELVGGISRRPVRRKRSVPAGPTGRGTLGGFARPVVRDGRATLDLDGPRTRFALRPRPCGTAGVARGGGAVAG